MSASRQKFSVPVSSRVSPVAGRVAGDAHAVERIEAELARANGLLVHEHDVLAHGVDAEVLDAKHAMRVSRCARARGSAERPAVQPSSRSIASWSAVGGRRLAVHHEGRLGRRAARAQPARASSRRSACTENAGHAHHLGAHGDVAAEQLQLARAVGERPAARARGLEADQEHRVARVGQAVREVVQHAAAARHPRRRDDDRRRRARR